MKVSLNGYGESVTTFEAEDSVRAGYPVKMTGNAKLVYVRPKKHFVVLHSMSEMVLQQYSCRVTIVGCHTQVPV